MLKFLLKVLLVAEVVCPFDECAGMICSEGICLYASASCRLDV